MISRLVLILLVAVFCLGGYTSQKLASVNIKEVMSVYFLDVGQGDSILFRTPDNYLVIVDTGRAGSLLPALQQALGYSERQIELLIATHPDADHTEAALDLFSYFDVKNLLWVDHPKSNPLLSQIQAEAKLEGHNYYASRGQNIRIGCCLEFEILWPKDFGEGITQLDANDSSIALIAKYKDFSMYMAGDLSSELELESISGYTEDVDVLKVGHHGSNTSTSLDLLGLLNPEIAIISVGAENSYGHPHSEILQMLSSERIKQFRTDELGTIELTVGSSSYSIFSHKSLEEFTVSL